MRNKRDATDLETTGFLKRICSHGKQRQKECRSKTVEGNSTEAMHSPQKENNGGGWAVAPAVPSKLSLVPRHC